MNRLSAVRGICRLVSISRVRPGVASLPRWAHTTAVWCNRQLLPYENTSVARLRPQWKKADMLLFRQYSEDTTMTLSELQDGVLNVLKLFDKIDPDKVDLQAHFINDLSLDSLDVVEIVMAFEDEFGVEIDDEQAEKIFTANDAVELLKTKLDVH